MIVRFEERQPRQELPDDQGGRHRRKQGKQSQRHGLGMERAVDRGREIALHHRPVALGALPSAQPLQLGEEGVGVAGTAVETHHQLVATLAQLGEVVPQRIQRRRGVDQVTARALDLGREVARRRLDPDHGQ